METNRPIPFMAIHAGEYLKELLEERGMKQSELSELSGTPKSNISNILKGKRDITPEQSVIFGRILGVEDDYLFRFQSRYEMDKARIAERVVEQSTAIKVWEIIKSIVNVKILKKAGIVKFKDVVEDVSSVLEMFGASSVDEILSIASKKENEPELVLVEYRKSEKLTTDPKDLFTWKYLCIYRDRNVKMDVNFDNRCQDSLIKELNGIFYDNHDTLARVKSTLAKYGINLIIEKKEGQVPVDGISFWINGHPTICLTMRHATIDKMAFNIMHELGHIFNHLKENQGAAINPIDKDNELKEREADKFAQKALISDEAWSKFRSGWKHGIGFDAYIKEFSTANFIHPRIVLGRYTHETKCYSVKSSIPKSIN